MSYRFQIWVTISIKRSMHLCFENLTSLNDCIWSLWFNTLALVPLPKVTTYIDASNVIRNTFILNTYIPQNLPIWLFRYFKAPAMELIKQYKSCNISRNMEFCTTQKISSNNFIMLMSPATNLWGAHKKSMSLKNDCSSRKDVHVAGTWLYCLIS